MKILAIINIIITIIVISIIIMIFTTAILIGINSLIKNILEDIAFAKHLKEAKKIIEKENKN